MENEKMEAIELTDDQAENITGGKCTVMECSNCLYSNIWVGDYLNKTCKCSRCGEDAFTGVRYTFRSSGIPV